MHTFDIQSADWNHTCVPGSSRNLFRILHNIPTVVGITHIGYSCKCGMYVRLIMIGLRLVIKFRCCRGGWCIFLSGGVRDQSDWVATCYNCRAFLLSWLSGDFNLHHDEIKWVLNWYFPQIPVHFYRNYPLGPTLLIKSCIFHIINIVIL